MEPENTTAVWGTYPSMELSSSSAYRLTSRPPTDTVPEDASYRRAMRLMTVDFPLAVGPIIASVSPLPTLNDTSCSTSASVPG